MNFDSKWKESVVDTSGIFLGLLVGIVFEKGIGSVFLTLFEVEIIVAAVVIGIAILLKRSEISSFKTYRRLVLRGARWVVGVLAGFLFTTGYALIVLVWWLGIPLTALYFGFVVSMLHFSKIVEGEGSESVPKKFGLSKEVTAKTLEQLLNKRDELQKKYDDLSSKHTAPVESLEMIGIRQQREFVDEKIAAVRDWYGLHVLEGLEEESRTLKWLTIVLIALTVVLAMFTGFLVSGIRVP